MAANLSDDESYRAFMGAFGVAPPGQEGAEEDLTPEGAASETPLPWEARESNANARLIGRRSGDMLREFLANGFTREEAVYMIMRMLPHHPH
ncbi:hypothetical protein SEA_RIOVINA_40 [Arthrobacter phage Riovina]|uniref:Uncharacterized protein n=4 Tax=Korravirus hunterdalle TaxID=1982080 RepID=A0A3G8FV82_9CAUD|nr:hypothetical protein SEA_ALEDEL_40 [Arthrobacter phage Aledel]AZS07725.1 hypothetical protein SEA_EUNOIA_40 [Arthrobacter phage Eunoia]AZS09187.1 hypothetical protein SEA_OMALLEY_40 [Arthrobacter phage OMalley]AZS09671.1 hypothetical protein SEA_RIOVINA_40 [Arthrobacter phage Riovina]